MPDRYDISRSWRWNLEHPPQSMDTVEPVEDFCGDWNWCGLPVNSPLGVAAGPLLNGAWLTAYANLGFDILVYKTVRTNKRDCYDLPNLVPVSVSQLSQPNSTVPASNRMDGSWAVSFGMPSIDVAEWQQDVAATRKTLRPGQILIVSVVGTEPDGAGNRPGLELLAADFAKSARLACEAGAHGIEANFSCPNVSTADGQLYQNPAAATVVARAIREAIGRTPLVLKIGFTDSADLAERLICGIAPFVDGLAMTNAIAARVTRGDGSLLFNGASRGICGAAIRAASVAQVGMFAKLIRTRDVPLQIIGVGGISNLAHVRDYLDAGATSVAMATAPMIDPQVAVRIRREQSF